VHTIRLRLELRPIDPAGEGHSSIQIASSCISRVYFEKGEKEGEERERRGLEERREGRKTWERLREEGRQKRKGEEGKTIPYQHLFFLTLSSVKDVHFCSTMRNGRLRSSKVVDFGTDQTHVCDILLVINSNLDSYLHHFWYMTTYSLTIANFPRPLSFNALDWDKHFRICDLYTFRKESCSWSQQ